MDWNLHMQIKPRKNGTATLTIKGTDKKGRTILSRDIECESEEVAEQTAREVKRMMEAGEL
jgi:hypothetical protein